MENRAVAGMFIAMCISLNICVLFAQEGPSKNKETNNQSDVSDVVIKGEAKDKIEIKKEEPKIDIQVEKLFDFSTEKTDELLQKDLVVPGEIDFAAFNRLYSKQVVRLYLPDIITPPLISFYPKLSKGKVKEWKLVVTNEEGRIIKTINGQGFPTKTILWEGKDEKDKMIKVNTIYSYKFIVVDQDDKSYTTLGDSFQVDALMYNEKGKVKIEVASKLIYPDKESVFLKKGMLVLGKIVDILREHSRYRFTIDIYADIKNDFKLAQDKNKLLTDYLSKELIILPEDIKLKSKQKEEERGEVMLFVIHVK